IRVESGRTTSDVDFVLRSPAIIHGKVTNGATGEPVYPVGVRISGAGRGRGAVSNMGKTDSEGNYRISLPLAKPSQLRVKWVYTHEGGTSDCEEKPDVQPFMLGPGEEKELDLVIWAAPATIPIRFVDEEGEPLPGIMPAIHVQREDQGENIGPGSTWGSGLISDTEGRTVWRGMSPEFEKYSVFGYRGAMAERNLVGTSDLFEIVPGEPVQEVLVVCEWKGDIQGVVLDSGGEPVEDEDFGLVAVLEEGVTSHFKPFTTGAGGAFTIQNAFPQGSYLRVAVFRQNEELIDVAVVKNVEILADMITDLGSLKLKPIPLEDMKAYMEEQASEK
ncbi:hypothetical protein ACFL1X_06855, partial [Candidatus Hydrogenedentota bacterium]